MNVYRIESEQGVGPYWSAKKHDSLEAMRNRHNSDKDRWPGPYDEGCSGHMRGKLCGFFGIAQLLAWFSLDEIRMMRSLGFRIVRVTNPHNLTILTKQCIFERQA